MSGHTLFLERRIVELENELTSLRALERINAEELYQLKQELYDERVACDQANELIRQLEQELEAVTAKPKYTAVNHQGLLKPEDEARIRDAVRFGASQRAGKWFIVDQEALLNEIDLLRDHNNTLHEEIKELDTDILTFQTRALNLEGFRIKAYELYEALKPFASGFPNTDRRDYEHATAMIANGLPEERKDAE